MRALMLTFLAAVVGFALTTTVPCAQAQVAVQLGPAPECPYGYFATPPYACAPAGYYGPEWFVGGVFIGAGPWFHGPNEFHGYVNNHYRPDHGYKGALPHRGEQPEASKRVDSSHFHGNEMRDGRGHVVNQKKK